MEHSQNDPGKFDAFDVLVVGAGPAGSSAARTLARAGLRVGLLDRAAFPRPKLCGGLLTTKTLRALDAAFDLDAHTLAERGAIIGQSSEYALFLRAQPLRTGGSAAPFHFCSRLRLDKLLLDQAIDAGARFFQGRAMQCNPGRGTVATEDGRTLRARFLIGADGVNSRLRRCLEPDRRRWRENLAEAIEIRLQRRDLPEALRPLQRPQLHVGYNRAGYGWVFPNPEALIIGICGLREPTPLPRAFRSFLRDLGIRDERSGNRITLHGHPLPYGNWLSRCAQGPLLLAGDAAGLVEPTLGEGIFYALMSGKYAALSILDELHGDGPAERRYARRLEKNLFPEFKSSNLLRNILLNGVDLLGYAPLSLFLGLGGGRLAEMVQGERSYHLLRKKRWEWE